MEKEKNVGLLIKQISEQTARQINRDMRDYNITCSQMRAMLFVAHSDGVVSQKDVEVALQYSHPTVVGILTGLEEKGLIRCAFDAADKRIKNVYITDEAKNLLHHAKITAETFSENAVKGFSECEIETLASLLTRMQENIKNLD